MSPRERNALLAPLTAAGSRQISRRGEVARPARSDEEEARLMLERFLRTLPCYSADELMRRCLFPGTLGGAATSSR